jgi:hypothetical protein
MIGDHHGRTAGRATLLLRAMDEILGTHSSVTAIQAVRTLLRPCAGRSVNVGRKVYGLMIT